MVYLTYLISNYNLNLLVLLLYIYMSCLQLNITNKNYMIGYSDVYMYWLPLYLNVLPVFFLLYVIPLGYSWVGSIIQLVGSIIQLGIILMGLVIIYISTNIRSHIYWIIFPWVGLIISNGVGIGMVLYIGITIGIYKRLRIKE